MGSAKKTKNIIAIFVKLAFLYLLLNLFFVSFAWCKSYFVDFGGRPKTFTLDLRKNKLHSGKFITFVSTQAEPEKKWLFGHLWVWFETTPPNEKTGTYQFGYYAANKTSAAIELAKASLNPLGFFVGQKPVLGQIQIDDPWPHHLELKVIIDDNLYQNALLAHKKWRNEKEYFNRPKFNGSSKGCQDYAFAIAQSIGLKTPSHHWGEFPPESFVKFARLNGVNIKTRPSFGAYFSKSNDQ